MFQHAALAEQVGAVGGEIFLLESGHPVEFTADGGAYKREPVTAAASDALYSGSARGNRGRSSLCHSQDICPVTAVAVLTIAIDKHTGLLGASPEIVTRGFLPNGDDNDILVKAREVILRTVEGSSLEEKMDWSVIKEKIRIDLKRFLNKQTAKRPLILPVILEV